jgi:hypothetical protein
MVGYDEMRLRFEIEDFDGLTTQEFTVEDATPWTEVMDKFADFLSAQYGYSFKEKMVFISNFTPMWKHSKHEQYITSAEYEMILKHREGTDLFSEWDDQENEE